MNPTASGLARAVECAASVVLPQCSDWSDAAERGIICHKYLERVICGVAAEDALASVPEEHRSWCSNINIEHILRGLL